MFARAVSRFSFSPAATAVLAVAWMLAVFAGVVAAGGAVIYSLVIAATVLGAGLLFRPRSLFVAVLVFALVVSGVAEYYFGFGQANWLASAMALLLLAAALFKVSSVVKCGRLRAPSIFPIVVTYLAALLLGSFIAGLSLTQFVVGMRNYLPFVGVLLACRYLANEEVMKRIPYLLVAIGLLQLPFCLHQALFVAPVRQHSFSAIGGAAESIVGTFGGNPFGGGYTGEMAVFVLLTSCIALAVPAHIGVKRWLLRAMPLVAVGCVGLAETKIVFILAPVVVGFVLLEDVVASPRRFLTMGVGCVCFLAVLAGIYAVRYWSASDGEFWHAFTYSFDPNFMVDAQHRGRVGALVHWWDQNVVTLDFLHTAFGYGVASTLEASRVLGEGNAVHMFGFGLDAHAANKLLWDSGVLGFGLFCWIIGRTALNAQRLVSAGELNDVEVGMLKVVRAGMIAFAAMLPYQVAMVGGAPMQALFWLFVGYAEYCRKEAVLRRSECVT